MKPQLRSIVVVLSFAALTIGSGTGEAHARERIIGGPCEGCENVFVDMPAELDWRAEIAGSEEAGERMVLEGTVRYLDGEPAGGIIVYAYHTDATGVYPDASTRHGRLRGWTKTNEDGAYRFDTIRPGAYPRGGVAEHVHMHIIEPGRVSYYIASVRFDDDPQLSDSERARAERGRGGSGLATPEKDAEGVWHVRRDISLGLNVPGYPCPQRWTFPVPFYQSISWSPDGSKLAVSAVTESWQDGYRIYLVGIDGSKPAPVVTGGQSDLYPVWSPDGTRIAFSSKRDGNTDVYVMNSDGSEVTRLTHDEATDGYPSWSPDGARIVFHSNRAGNYDVYTMNADGSDPRALTEHSADDYNPSWAPNGAQIVFESDRDGVDGDEIYVMSADGSGTSRVVDKGVFPRFSPDGERIAFARDGLFVVAADGADPERLLENSVCGAWSPDGTKIAAALTEYDEKCKDHHSVVIVELSNRERVKILP